jgi:hypothetical protein
MLRAIHIAGGTIGLLAGAAALSVRKGARAHAWTGKLFTVAMSVMAVAGTILSIVPTFDPLNIAAGLLTPYLVLTAWVTVRHAPATVGSAEPRLAAFGTAGVAVIAGLGVRAALLGHAAALPFFVMFGSILALAVVGDVRLVRRHGVHGRARLTRHLWRMGVAMLLATLSLFLGQPQVFPPAARQAGILPIPPALVALVVIYFLVQQRRANKSTPASAAPSLPQR